MKMERFQTALPFTEAEIRVWTARSDERVIHSYGIEFKGLLYNCNGLAAIRRHWERHRHYVNDGGPSKGEPVFIKHDPENMGDIWVLDPLSNQYIQVPCTFRDYAEQMTLRRHLLNLKVARHNVETVVDPVALMAAHKTVSELIQQASVHDLERVGRAVARAAIVAPPAATAPTSKEDTASPIPELPVFAAASPAEPESVPPPPPPSTDQAPVEVNSPRSPTAQPPTPPPTDDLDIDALADSWCSTPTKRS